MVTTLDAKNGKTLSYNLKVPQLVPNAILLLFPNCPTYLSTATNLSKCTREKKSKQQKQNKLAMLKALKTTVTCLKKIALTH